MLTFMLGLLLSFMGLGVLFKTIEYMKHDEYDGFIITIVIIFLVVVPVWLGVIMVQYDVRDNIQSEPQVELTNDNQSVVYLSTKTHSQNGND